MGFREESTVCSRRFYEDDCLSTGEEDFGAAFRIWAAREGLVVRRRWLVGVGGMLGGFWSVGRARSFLEANLAATRFTQESLACVRGRLDPSMPLCVVHVRRGNFAENRSEESIQGKFNVGIDPAWYSPAIDAVLDLTKGRVNILVISNAHLEELENLTSKRQVMTTVPLAPEAFEPGGRQRENVGDLGGRCEPEGTGFDYLVACRDTLARRLPQRHTFFPWRCDRFTGRGLVGLQDRSADQAVRFAVLRVGALRRGCRTFTRRISVLPLVDVGGLLWLSANYS